ncbi:MAG: LCP family protein, partial [Dethiobacteria bacterium]|nr:LCP family protein [Dethiobacteria bacterium]
MLKDQGDRDSNSLPESNKDGANAAIPAAGNNADAPVKAEETPENLKIDGIEEQISISVKSGDKYQFSKLKKILLLTGAVLAVLLIAAGIFLLVFYKQIQETQQVVLDENTSDANVAIVQEETVLNDVYTVFPEHIVNIGLLGFDRGWDREARGHYMFRPDVQALVSIDFDRDQISVIRILRDSYVPIHGAGGFHDKINHAYQYGYYSGDGEDPNADGIHYTLLTMSNVLGDIPIHYYVSVDMYSIIALVNAFGGIYYNVEEEIVDKVWVYGVLLPP